MKYEIIDYIDCKKSSLTVDRADGYGPNSDVIISSSNELPPEVAQEDHIPFRLFINEVAGVAPSFNLLCNQLSVSVCWGE